MSRPPRSPLDRVRRRLGAAAAVLVALVVVAVVATVGSLRLLTANADVDALEAVRLWNEALLVVVAVLAIAMAVLGLLVWRLLRQEISVPLARLAHEVRAASTGDHGHEIPAVGSGEVASLAQDVEQMRRELVAQVEDARPRTRRSRRRTTGCAARPRSSSAPTVTWSSSPTSRPTTCRSPCARSPASRSSSRSGTATSSTTGRTSTSRSPWTVPTACSGSSRTC